jgi:hypothetical protein
MYLREKGCEDSNGSGQDLMASFAMFHNSMEFFYQLSKYQMLKEDLCTMEFIVFFASS